MFIIINASIPMHCTNDRCNIERRETFRCHRRRLIFLNIYLLLLYFLCAVEKDKDTPNITVHVICQWPPPPPSWEYRRRRRRRSCLTDFDLCSSSNPRDILCDFFYFSSFIYSFIFTFVIWSDVHVLKHYRH